MKTVAISASFTVEVIQPSLDFLLETVGDTAEIQFAAYNQVFQEILNPGSLLRTNTDGINVVLIRFEDWLHYQKDHPTFSGARALIEKNIHDLIEGITGIPRHQVPMILGVAAPSPTVRHDPDARTLHEQFETLIEAALRDVKNVYFFRSTEIDTLYPVEDYFDAHTDRAGHIPFTQEYFAALGATVARKIYAITAKPFKVIASDCDETLWRGIAGELGAGVTVDESARFLQTFLAKKKDEGIVLCLCSKNELETVEEVFNRNQKMVLSMNDVATHRVNWESKHANLQSLADELNLGLESFIFIDDSPAECNEVRRHHPEVLSICLPTDPTATPQLLRHIWAFDRPRVTAEDKERNTFYQENAKRQQQQSTTGSLQEYIASLELNIVIAEPDPSMIARLAQLSQRTNQFNNTSLRYTETDLTDLVNDPAAFCRYVNVSDRFGEYGIVGLVTGRFVDDTLIVRGFLMSCRAMSRGVEFRMVQNMGQNALERGMKWVQIEFLPSARNKPIANFLESLPIDRKFETDGKTQYVLPASQVAEMKYQASETPEETATPAPAKTKTPNPGEPDLQKQHDVLLEIATHLDTPKKILTRMREQTRRSADGRDYVAPANPVEECIARFFCEILNLDRVSAEESFFDLGGFSLAATLLGSKIHRTFQVTCDLDTISIRKTPRSLAEYLTDQCDVSQLDLTDRTADERLEEAERTVRGGTLRYAHTGHGTPVILLHGLFGRKEHCYELAAYLAPFFHVVIPDLPGFGGSTGFPASAYRFDKVLEILDEFFEQLGLQSFHLAGNSMGASLAGIYAARFPHKTLSLAFLGPPAISCPKISEVEQLARDGVNISVPKTLDQFHQKIDFLFQVKPRVLQDQLDTIGNDEVAHYDDHIKVFDIVQKDDLMLDRYLDQIACPTLIIWGENDRFKDVSGAHAAAEKLTRSELQILPRAGHALFQEYPERISELYKNFLSRVRPAD